MSGIEHLKNFLDTEDYPYEEKDSYIAFKFEGTQYMAPSNGDSDCLQLSLVFYDVTEDNFANVLWACNKVNNEKLLVKLCADDSVWVNCEFFPGEDTTAERYEQILNMMVAAQMSFLDTIEEAEEQN